MPNQTCDKCRWWKQYRWKGADDVLHVTRKGECRLHSPQSQIHTDVIARSNSAFEWPFTKDDDWCGDWTGPEPRLLARHQPCGCIVCICEDAAEEDQCQGCGAKNCGTHPPGELPKRVYRGDLEEKK